MRVHIGWRSLMAGVGLALVVPVAGLATTAGASGMVRHSTAAAGKSSTPVVCKKRTKAHGTVKYSDWQFPDTLNPYQASASVDGETTDATLQPLVDYNASSQLYPVMLTRLPTLRNKDITGGGKTIILHLKKGMLWSNGTEITSKDVKFGWQVGMDKTTGPRCTGTCDAIRRIDTPDKYTAVLRLKRIYSLAVPNALPDVWPHTWPGAWTDVHSAAVKLAQDQKFNFEGPNYPTNGPFEVAEFVQNDRIVLHPMKHYDIMNCGASVATLIFAFYSSKAGMMAAAADKQTDVTENYTTADLPELDKHRSTFKVHSVPAYNYEHLELNIDPTWKGQPNPLHDTNVRLALALALDKIGLIQSALGLNVKQAKNVVAWTPWINTPQLRLPFADKSINGQWDPLQKKYVIPGKGKALTDARKLLAKTQWKDGFTVEFATTSGNPTRLAQESVVAAGWAKIGVKVSADFIPSSTFFADFGKGGTMHQGNFQVCQFTSTLSPSFEDIKYRLQSKYIDRESQIKSSLNYNYSGIHDKIFDRDLNLATTTYNKKQQQKYYNAVQTELNQKAYWITFYFRPFISTANSNVRNFNPSPLTLGWNKYAWGAGNS